MKIKELVAVCNDYDRIKIKEEVTYTVCLTKDGTEVDCGSCGGNYDECPADIEHEDRRGFANRYDGAVKDVPIKLADKRVKNISVTIGRAKRVWLEVSV